MRVRCMGSVKLMFGIFFSEVHKFLCHVSQIVFASRELSGPGVK
jgi:hypothetical protein